MGTEMFTEIIIHPALNMKRSKILRKDEQKQQRDLMGFKSKPKYRSLKKKSQIQKF